MHVLENAEWLHENNSLSAPLDSGPTALAAHTGGRSSLICSNCKKLGHTVDYCILPGGGMARKTIEESKLACREAQKRKTSSSPQHKVPIKVWDVEGCTYITYTDGPDTSLDQEPQPPPASAFVSVADRSNQVNAMEYDGWIAVEEEPRTSIDWNLNQTNINAFAATAQKNVPIPLEEHLFYCNTGATVHLSPEPSDFVLLQQITSRSVKGVGGSSISALGIGDIRLCIAPGLYITL
ncbi:hypothetical protein AX17_006555 [Amanita inopinata Kibby_2008]|nr:hypothetical protein AX17_006555 [Amanita inopinata Kibby_2008]